MPRTPEQNQAIREEKKRQIMDAALELFANEGFHSTSISKIAKASNISKGLLYNYFESKEDLLKEIAQKGLNEIFRDLNSEQDTSLSEKDFVMYVDKMFEAVVEQHQFWKLFYTLFFQPGAYKLLIGAFEEKATGYYNQINAYFIHRGFDAPMDELFFFTSVMEGAAMQYVFSPMEFNLSPIRKKLIQMYAPNYARENNI